jgi:plastocyanin
MVHREIARRYVVIILTLVIMGSGVYAAQHAIGQKGRLFRPGALTVKAGDTVTFKNDDTVTHHVYSSTKGQEFDLETTRPGQDVRRTFAAAGRVDVRCGLHPGMRLVITVE